MTFHLFGFIILLVTDIHRLNTKQEKKVLLAIDAGNTNIVIGVFETNELVSNWRVATERHKLADEYGMLIRGLLANKQLEHTKIHGIIVSSVVPEITSALVEMSERSFGVRPVVVSADEKIGIEIRCGNPAEVGSDRIVNAIGAYVEYGGPLIVVDFGTATTFDAIAEDGAYLGGAIAPGINISINALFENAAKLMHIDICQPRKVVGKNTVESLQSGIYYGFLGQMEEIIRQMKVEMGNSPKVVATGGLAELVAVDSELVDAIDKNLTLKGLKTVYDRIN